MTTRLVAALALASALTVVAVAFYYVPLRVDGGWASYAAFALTQDRDPYLHQTTLEEQADVPGVKALFPFDTVSNSRALYASLWLRVAGTSWVSIKTLALLELTFLMFMAGAMYRRLLPREIATLALALLATDKVILVVASADFRPDVIQAGMACAFYLALTRAPTTPRATAGLAVIAAVFGTMSLTAVTPIAMASAVRVAEIWLSGGEDRRRHIAQLGFVVVVAATFYLIRTDLFPLLLGAERPVLEPVEAVDRIADFWAGGPIALLGKEIARWGNYVGGSNAPLLLAVGVGLVAWLLASGGDPTVRRRALLWWAGAVTGIVVLTALDGSPRDHHIVPVAPFLLLTLGPVGALPATLRRAGIGALAALVILSSLLGFALAGRLASQARQAGFSNPWLVAQLSELKPPEGAPLVVVGGSEFWPYWDPGTDVTIIDYAGGPSTLELLRPDLDEIDFAVLGADYLRRDWLALVGDRFDLVLTPLVDRPPYLVVANGFQ